MKRFAAALLAGALLAPIAADAQQAPFDMSPERQMLPPAREMAPPAPNANPAPQIQPQATRRYLLQTPKLRLQGETASEGWTFYLTPEQAASEAGFDLSYSNAVVIAPEISRLSVSINGTAIADHAIQSADAEQRLAMKIAPGILRPGLNRIRIQADQRHRTDCTLDSTYALWTDIDAAETFLSFSAPAAGRMTRLEDIQAIGVDPQGRSRFLIVAPALGQSNASQALLRLSQGLSMLSGAVNASFSFSRTLPEKTEPGEIVVLAATPSEIADLPGVTGMPQPGGTLAGFVPFPGKPDAAMLAFVGSDWGDIGALADSFVALAGSRYGDPGFLGTEGWRSSDTPLIEGERRLRFSALGVPAQEFSGRRFATNFTVAMPADFYANAYGTATILLDAAYSSKVIPGSRFNVTVNGQLATTVPITASGGAVLRHYPVRVSMRHFRPGVNTIALEAVLSTQDDATCAPGSTADKTPRFALFDTSEFVIPEFARMSRAPDLAATAGLGFPFASGNPTAVFLGARDEATLAAAATTIGKLSLAARRGFSLLTTTDAREASGHNALFVGTAGELPQEALSEITLPAGAASPAPGDSSLNADAWRDKVDSGTLLGLLASLNGWMKETFNLDLTAISFWPQGDAPYQLPGKTGIFVSQSVDPDHDTIRTTVSAPDKALLESGTRQLGDRENWQALDGRVSLYDTGREKIETVEAASPQVLSFGPPGFTNLRLVLANWFSSNFIAYAFALALAAVLLGLATNALLGRLGRERED